MRTFIQAIAQRDLQRHKKNNAIFNLNRNNKYAVVLTEINA